MKPETLPLSLLAAMPANQGILRQDLHHAHYLLALHLREPIEVVTYPYGLVSPRLDMMADQFLAHAHIQRIAEEVPIPDTGLFQVIEKYQITKDGEQFARAQNGAFDRATQASRHLIHALSERFHWDSKKIAMITKSVYALVESQGEQREAQKLAEDIGWRIDAKAIAEATSMVSFCQGVSDLI